MVPLALLLAVAPARQQPHPLVVAAVPSMLSAGSATLNGLAYAGTVAVPRASGPPLRMMKFTLTSAILKGRPRLAVHGAHGTVVITATAMSFTGHVVLYTTKLQAGLAGRRVTLTPASPRAQVSRLLAGLAAARQAAGGVVADHPLALAGTAALPGLTLSTR
jgi:hypothetical protein